MRGVLFGGDPIPSIKFQTLSEEEKEVFKELGPFEPSWKTPKTMLDKFYVLGTTTTIA